jgi:hypothetical protein
MSGSELSSPRVSASEANYWWRQNTSIGALLNKLLLLFIVVPIALVLKNFYTLSILVFALMIPYGLFVQRLAVHAVRQHLEKHPEEQEQFEQDGIISW